MKTMQHWNGHQLCVIDTETTGLDPNFHEVIQVCILALDSNINPRKDVMPFYIDLIPEHPERVSSEAMSVNKMDLAHIAQHGHDREMAKDLLEEWVAKLDLPCTKYGNSKKILPLGQNYGFDKGFLQSWLGVDMYNELFFYRVRDTQATAIYLNDRAAMHAEKVPFSKTKLSWLCSTLDVENLRAHDALSDCLATAEVYKKMLMKGLF